MKKPAILFLYGVALYFVLRRYYSQGNSGLPLPSAIASPTYLYGILLLSADFTGGLSMVLAAGLTVALIWQSNAQTAKQPNVNPRTNPKAAGPVPTSKTQPVTSNFFQNPKGTTVAGLPGKVK